MPNTRSYLFGKGDAVRVLGIDPGYATTGYAVVERRAGRLLPACYGVIRTPPGDSQAERLVFLHRALLDLIADHRPEVMALERLFFNANVRTAMAVGQASGVALVSAGETGLEVHDYTPTEVKQSVTGTGGASKQQVQAMVAALLDLDGPPKPADAADACALAICHLNRSGLAAAVKRASVS
ncbi:MAG: crossover junction endodeoxyribonuclease RuvC [Actinomycetota bacterium]